MLTQEETPALAFNEETLMGLLGKAAGDIGATFFAPLMIIGHELGLYSTLAEQGPLTSAELASYTNTAERYIREWLRTNAAGGYINYDADADRYSMSTGRHPSR